jgi:filamentous hemagglutinin
MESPPAGEEVYLFRGTTRGWPGNPAAQKGPFTYASPDPLVATLFAVECRSRGAGVVLVAKRGCFEEVPPGPFDMRFQALENQVVLATTPLEFAEMAKLSLEVDRCLEVLTELGFTGLPIKIHAISHLRRTLFETHSLGQRLNSLQIQSFMSRIIGES